MSNRVVKVGLTFEFYPDTEHDFLFEGMTEEQIIKDAMRMTTDDIHNLSNNGEVMRCLVVSVTTE